MKALRVLAALIVATIALASLTTCKPITYYLGQVYKVYGRVTDESGMALESVEVSIKGYQYSELTNGLGDYELELAEGTWILEFAKDGYTTKPSEPFQVGPSPLAQRYEVNATLSPIVSPAWWTWMIGFWAETPTYAPYTKVIEIQGDGSVWRYDNYDCTGEPMLWPASISSIPNEIVFYGTPYSIVKISDNEWEIPDFRVHLYRKGTEPGGNVFSQTPAELTAGTWAEGSLARGDMKLYSFTTSPTGAGNYNISWQRNDSGTYTADIVVSAYAADKATAFFVQVHDGYDTPQTVTLAASEKTFIIVDALYIGGIFAVRIQ